MSWIIGLVLFVGGLVLGGLIMLFVSGEIEDKSRDKKEVEEEVSLLEETVALLEARVDCLERRGANQLRINETQGEINQIQKGMNEHLTGWIREVSKAVNEK